MRREFEGQPEFPEQAARGIRAYEVFLVDAKGQMSHGLRAQVMGTPGSTGTRPKDMLAGSTMLEVGE